MSLNDLEGLCRQHAERHASGGVWFVDLYAQNKEMQQYQNIKINCEVLNVVYSASGKTIDKPDLFVEEWFDNDTSVPQKQTFSKSTKTTSSFTWSLTEGLKVSTKVGGKVGLPLVAEGSVEVTTELNFSSTQSKTETKEETWTCTKEITVPPQKSTRAVFAITQKDYDVDYTADILITGNFAFWSNNKIDLNNPGGNDLHWLWFPGITAPFSEKPQPNYKVQYTPKGYGVVFTCHGKFTGTQGISSNFRATEGPLRKSRSMVSKDVALVQSIPKMVSEVHDDQDVKEHEMIQPRVEFVMANRKMICHQ